jgi:hypothetical protein
MPERHRLKSAAKLPGHCRSTSHKSKLTRDHARIEPEKDGPLTVHSADDRPRAWELDHDYRVFRRFRTGESRIVAIFCAHFGRCQFADFRKYFQTNSPPRRRRQAPGLFQDGPRPESKSPSRRASQCNPANVRSSSSQTFLRPCLQNVAL